MPVTDADIMYVFSGGASNADPNASLGGDSSTIPIAGTILFNDVPPQNALDGSVDYRCIYVVNDSPTQSLYSASIILASQVPNGAYVQLGFDITNDRQVVTITNFSTITGGYVVLNYIDTSVHTVQFDYDSSVSTFANNLQSAIRLVPFLDQVTVNGSLDANNLTLEINFAGSAGKRYHKAMTLNANSLTYTGSAPTVTVIKTVDGSPINTVADVIDMETTPPTNIVFSDSVFAFGAFRPFDQIPVWIQRATPPESTALEGDGFTIRVRGTAYPDPIVITPNLLPAGTVGVPYTHQLSTLYNSGSVTWDIPFGELPGGLNLSPSGLISGTPTIAVTNLFTVTVLDAIGATGSRSYSLVIS